MATSHRRLLSRSGCSTRFFDHRYKGSRASLRQDEEGESQRQSRARHKGTADTRDLRGGQCPLWTIPWRPRPSRGPCPVICRYAVLVHVERRSGVPGVVERVVDGVLALVLQRRRQGLTHTYTPQHTVILTHICRQADFPYCSASRLLVAAVVGPYLCGVCPVEFGAQAGRLWGLAPALTAHTPIIIGVRCLTERQVSPWHGCLSM